MTNKKTFLCFIICLIVFCVFTLLVSNGTFIPVDEYFFNLTGELAFPYLVSKVIGIAALAYVALFAVKGFVQLIDRKSLKKVDKSIIVLGCLYILVMILYVLFSKWTLQFRPDGSEPSYPSSHVLMFAVVFTTAIGFFEKKSLKVLTTVLLIAGVVCRAICGCHWLSDIVGSLILSASLDFLYLSFI